MVRAERTPRLTGTRARNSAPSLGDVRAALLAYRNELAAWRAYVESMTSRAERVAFATLSAAAAQHEARVEHTIAAHRVGDVVLADVASVVDAARTSLAAARSLAAEGT